MLQTYSGIKLSACIFLLLLLLSACGSTDTTTTTDSNAPNKLITVTTRQGSSSTPPIVVTAKSVGGSSQGSSGSGPVVVVSPTPIPGDHTNSQQVVLKDRTLVIGSVSKQNGVNAASSLITLALTVKNTSSKTIMNQPTFFQLMGAEGDTFSYQTNSSDNFYGNVTANSSRSGTIVFQIPGAAAHHLRLLYRPEVAAETTLVLLNV
ncbi:hypothetical protein KSF_102660 [Reticulibacter mediterranei]|jgi:hypothetical protein|uniref:DUF4352 domain-containing protein n=1 Tax=Reticulibacter mediterranei TaxID=2778369 RepID=A0A8J3ITH3_9CHLR|nr:DUF4352 domain-containing protein [Reticulibacter mediterranei]GHP00219.1 hypothetical protein KSF_102660 [Reticulibacter mediterranei]